MIEQISWVRLDDSTHSVSIRNEHGHITWDCFLSQLIEAQPFRTKWIRFLQDVDFPAIRWECPPLKQTTLDAPFECVILNSPSLIKSADPTAFAEWFNPNSDLVCSFPSLRGDSQLIAPCPVNEHANYAHLQSTMDTAAAEQSSALWQLSATEVKRIVASRTVWFNTAGAGVPWLHIRLDSRPKYYKHLPYRNLELDKSARH